VEQALCDAGNIRKRFWRVGGAGRRPLVDVDGKTFAITFGTGRHILKPESIEERFGLLVVLNSIKADAIKSIDKKTIDAISKQTREQASREVDAQSFGLDIERDLLRAVTGTPTDVALGQKLSGSDSLKITVRADLSDLPALIGAYYAKYKEKVYRENFPWVDQITEVKSKAKRRELDEGLIKCIVERRFERCWLAAPDIMDWNVVAGFRYGFSVKRPLYPDLDFADFLDSLGDQAEVTGDTLERKVCCYGEDEVLLETWPTYKCINCEIDDAEGNAFLLSGGKWYRVTKDFVKEVNSFVGNLTRYPFAFPKYGHQSEAEYNREVSNSDNERFVLCDAKNIPYGGGKSKIEFCDVYDRERVLVHIKRYGGSSVLSHLFSQGLIFGELFVSDQAFRKRVAEELGIVFEEGKRYTIVFAIISKSKGDELELPFFSRLNLKYAVRRLTSFGYVVAIAKIGLQEEDSPAPAAEIKKAA
jgi:uncharacterized protein (TIGR04141 family)